MIIMVNCIVNEQVSNLAMIIIQTVNNININSYVCKKYGNNLSIRTKSVWANIIDPAQSDQAYYICNSPWRGWSGGAMVLGKFPVPGRPAYLD